MNSIYALLKSTVCDFEKWSTAMKNELEWETQYPYWSTIKKIYQELIETTNFNEWDTETINNVLFLIARDNECEILASSLCDMNPECLYFLSKYALNYYDPDAKWQLAYYISKIYNRFPGAEEIILNYYNDSHEYVKRRALLSLGYINSKYAEQCALNSWESNLEYQKITALHTLYEINSPKLKIFLQKAEEDLSETVRTNANQIKDLIT